MGATPSLLFPWPSFHLKPSPHLDVVAPLCPNVTSPVFIFGAFLRGTDSGVPARKADVCLGLEKEFDYLFIVLPQK